MTCLVIVTLIFGITLELSNAANLKDCSCCDNKCQSAAKCQDKVKACVCSRQFNLQPSSVFSRGAYLYKLAFSDYLVQKAGISYLYLSSEDIFHPPKV
jgi:hypothetical protein